MIGIKNVSFKYSNSDKDVLKNINIDIRAGELVLFIGESGSGKTSMTRLINGLIPEFYEGDLRGEIILDRSNIGNLLVSQIAGTVGSVFQDPRQGFFSTDTTSELAFALENSGIESQKIRRRVEETIEDLYLDDLKDRNIFELSGGEKQRIAIGSVYTFNPKIIVLDEPSSNLDEKNIKRLGENLKFLKDKGHTIVVAEHRIRYLLDIIDRAFYMKNGEIVETFLGQDLRRMKDEERKKKGLRNLSDDKLFSPRNLSYGKKLLEVRNVKYEIKKGEKLLKGINFTLAEGEVLGITGVNGQGKSTLLQILCGIKKEKKGVISFLGKKTKAKDRFKRCYYLMQDSDYQLFTDSVMNEFLIGDIKASKKEIMETLDELSLGDYINRHPLSLSGGEKQRLCIAVAKLKEAEVICFDEPTSGLDYKNMLKVNEMINSLREKKKGLIIVSHDREFLNKTCHKLLVLKEGNLIQIR